MIKSKAKTLVSLLIEANHQPTIRRVDEAEFIVYVQNNEGVPTSSIANIDLSLGVTAKIKAVEFE